MFFIDHNTDNFTVIDCCLSPGNQTAILKEVKYRSSKKGITRFISTHPDEDHIQGLKDFDNFCPIYNFYVAKNAAVKAETTDSFSHYKKLRDGEKAFFVEKGSQRKWMNESSEERKHSGISILWPEANNPDYKKALSESNSGTSFNNISVVIKYAIGNVSLLWLGDLETEFMEKITDSIQLSKVTIVFAAHHGRDSGKIPDSCLEKLQPEVVILGEAPSRNLHYYTEYNTISQNSAGDITMEIGQEEVDFYVANSGYGMKSWLTNKSKVAFPNYIGTLKV